MLKRAGNQMRMTGAAVVGIDLGAALVLADALGLSSFLAAEILSDIEPTVVSALNRAIGDR